MPTQTFSPELNIIWSSFRPRIFHLPGIVGCGTRISLDAYASIPLSVELTTVSSVIGFAYFILKLSAIDKQRRLTTANNSYVPSWRGTNSTAQWGFIDTYSQSSPGFSKRNLSGLQFNNNNTKTYQGKWHRTDQLQFCTGRT